MEGIIHKKEYISSVIDTAPIGKRTAVCGKIVSNVEVHNYWSRITCTDCISFKGIATNVRKDKPRIKARK